MIATVEGEAAEEEEVVSSMAQVPVNRCKAALGAIWSRK